jgi:curved DNA-binding protein CbpA
VCRHNVPNSLRRPSVQAGSRGAPFGATTRRYRELLRRWHPDLSPHPEAHDRTVELNRAYAILGNPDLRARYDRNPDRFDQRAASVMDIVRAETPPSPGLARKHAATPAQPRPPGSPSIYPSCSPVSVARARCLGPRADRASSRLSCGAPYVGHSSAE